MTQKRYIILSGVIFALIGLLHLLRIIFHWPAIIGTSTVPFTLSLIVIVIAAALAIWAFNLSRTAVS